MRSPRITILGDLYLFLEDIMEEKEKLVIKEECDFLKELLETPSPSGYEVLGATEVFKKFCSENGGKLGFTDTMGNCAYYIGPGESETSIMISGHIDEIALQVSMITEDGLLNVVRLGGIDRKCILGQEVEILSSIQEKIIPGVIGKKPIHTEDWNDNSQVCKEREILVDIGADSKEEAAKLVSIGDSMVIKRNARLSFGPGNRLMSKGLDDKIGVYVSALVLSRLSREKPGEVLGNKKIWCASIVQEETGLRGAKRLAKIINPKYSIDIDVTFATDDGRGIEKEIYGDIKLGKGPVIMHGPDKSPRLIKIMKEVAKEHNIKYQEAVSRAGGTNTSAIQEYSTDTETVHLAIPQRNMHTPVEICDWIDIEEAVDLIYYTLHNLQ